MKMQKKNATAKGLPAPRTETAGRQASPHRWLMLALTGVGLLYAPQVWAGAFGDSAVTVNEDVLNSLGSGRPQSAGIYATGDANSYGGSRVNAQAPAGSGAGEGAGSGGASGIPNFQQVFPTQAGSAVLPDYPLLFPPRSYPKSVAVAPQGTPAPVGGLSRTPLHPAAAAPADGGDQQIIPPAPPVTSKTPSTPPAPNRRAALPAPAPAAAPVMKSTEPARQTAEASQPPKPVTLPAKPVVEKPAEQPAKAMIPTTTEAAKTTPEEDPAGQSLATIQAPAPPPAPAPAPASKQPEKPTSSQPEEAPAAKSAEPTQLAAAPPSAETPEGVTRLLFAAEQTDLSNEAKNQLDKVAADLKANSDLRIQLLAYAGGEDLSVNRSRRLSLNRALKVRAYLLKQDIRSTRMDVRALGKVADDGAKNRVDIKQARR